jgi:hypothetical protein
LNIKATVHQYNNNNNQAFYSQASWDRLEMKSHEPNKKNSTKQERKIRGKQSTIKKPTTTTTKPFSPKQVGVG